jgi:hypothetical protein
MTFGNEPESAAPARRPRRGRWTVVLTLIVGIILSYSARKWAISLQVKAYNAGPYANAEGAAAAGPNVASAVGSLDSYFLVLMLGGLRGPLVMYLWVSSENQKNERDLEDFNTKINLIRLLQPEFLSAQSFQIWNKAFNISVQIPSLPDRYAVILDAGEDARALDRGRPNSVDLLLMLNQVYQQKLGQTTGDSVYYRQHVREDSKARSADAARSVGTLGQRMQPVLDQKDDILPQLVKPIQPRPGNLDTAIHVPLTRIEELKEAAAKAKIPIPQQQLSPTSSTAREIIVHLPESQARTLAEKFYPYDVHYVWSDWNDGSELQYLKQYEPYPYGVSPLALGFNYGKRAQVLVNRTKQRPNQLSASVVDSRPGLELRDWGREERDRAVAAEIRAYYPALAAESEVPLPQRFARWVARGSVTNNPNAGFDSGRLLEQFKAQPTSNPPPRPVNIPIDELALEREAASRLSAKAPPAEFGKQEFGVKGIKEALYGYRQAMTVMRDGTSEYVRHVTRPVEGNIHPLQDFASHMDELTLEQLLTEADFYFLLAQLPDEEARKVEQFPGYEPVVGRIELLKRAVERYNTTLTWSQYTNLRYYSPGELQPLVLPPQTSGNPIEQLVWDAEELMRNALIAKALTRPPFGERDLPPGPPASLFPDPETQDRNKPPPQLHGALRIIWGAATVVRQAEQGILPYRQPWRMLTPAAPRERPEVLRDEPMVFDQIARNMSLLLLWAPSLDQNAGTRIENQPFIDRAFNRRNVAFQQLVKLGAVPGTMPTTGPTTLPATLPATGPATAPSTSTAPSAP